MARPRSSNPRNVVVTVRLTQRQADHLDRARGHLTRAEWLRWLLTQDAKK